MHRVDATGHYGNTFTDGGSGVEPTTLAAKWHNAVQEELANVIEASGQTLSAADNTQLSKAFPSTITPIAYGAEGDGSTDDSTAFTALEAAQAGKYVDLLGNTYVVSALPEKCRYYNGAISVSGTIYPFQLKPKEHPLEGYATVTDDNTDIHYWPGPVGHVQSSDIIIGVVVAGYRHNVSIGAPLIARQSYDGGAHWEKNVTVYSNALYEPRGLAGGMVSSSVFGVMYVLIDSAGAINSTKFSYTADNGVTWTTVDVGTTSFYPHGDLVIDDSGNLLVYGYGGGNIHYAKSTDSGATWSVAQAVAGGAVTAVEPAVAKIDTNKYVMIVRNDAGGNAYGSTSTNGTTWTSLVDSNLPLGLNPPYLVCYGGALYTYMCSRQSTPIQSWEDKLLYCAQPAADVYTDGGAYTTPLSIVPVYSGKAAMIGYLTVAKFRSVHYIGYLIDGEQSLGSTVATTSRMVRLGGIGLAAGTRPRSGGALIANNPTFNHWGRGTTFSSITSATKTAERWFNSSSTAGVDVSRVETTEVERRIVPFSPRYAMYLQSASGGSGRTIAQRFYGKDAAYPYSERVITFCCYVSGTLPGYYRFYSTFNFGGGGSATVETYVNATQTSMAGGINMLTGTIQTPSVDGATWGTSPYFEIKLLANGSGTVDARVLGFWANFGDAVSYPDPANFDAERAVLDKYCEVITVDSSDLLCGVWVDSTTTCWGELNWIPKVTTPALSLASGTAASDFSVNGSIALSTFTFDLISPSRCRCVGGGTGFTSGSMAELRSGGNSKSIIVDVGH